MQLHPQRRVAQFLSAHLDTLTRYQGILDLVVPKAFAVHEEDYPDITQLPGDVLSAAVRGKLWPRAERLPAVGRTLTVATRGTSRHLVDSRGESVRIRRHPWSFKLGCRVPVVEPAVDTLYGTLWSLAPYELAILWTPDYKSKALGSAALAAVGGLDSVEPKIYARVDLPLADVLGEASRASEDPRMGEVTDDFGDFGEDESLGFDDPA